MRRYLIEGQQVKTIYTTEVQAEQLHDERLHLTPGVFQPRIQSIMSYGLLVLALLL